MLEENFDTRHFDSDIQTLIAECTQIKRALRRRWPRSMAEEQRRLVRLRRRLTELFVVRAFRRGRHHVTSPPQDVRDAGAAAVATWSAHVYATAIVTRVLPEYTTALAKQVAS